MQFRACEIGDNLQSKKYVLHIAQNYSFEILRPIQTEILKRGDDCIWFVASENVDLSRFTASERVITSPKEASGYKSTAVFTPGNIVPSFLNGLKVQVFHGLEWKKKGHFRIRDFFDLYCTQGPITTNKFMQLAGKHKNFLVCETGWTKLDPLFSVAPYDLIAQKPVILYAPTFSQKLTSVLDCFEEIKSIAKSGKYHWLVKFHPLMDAEAVKMYKKLQCDNFTVIEDHSILPLLQRADVMLSDTSSVIGEFLLLNKPVVTFKNSVPDDSLIDIQSADQLAAAIEEALRFDGDLKARITQANLKLHPYVDGLSSKRVLDECDRIIDNNIKPIKKRPLNIWRNLKIRKHFNYWL